MNEASDILDRYMFKTIRTLIDEVILTGLYSVYMDSRIVKRLPDFDALPKNIPPRTVAKKLFNNRQPNWSEYVTENQTGMVTNLEEIREYLENLYDGSTKMQKAITKNPKAIGKLVGQAMKDYNGKISGNVIESYIFFRMGLEGK